jgi:UTP--glucose-1-phosphate uridylyltransferase
VLLPDVIVKGKPSSLKQMVDAFDKVGGNIIAVDPVPEERVSSYGVIAPKSRDGRLIAMSGMVEKPPRETAPSNLAITGRYILQPEIFGLLEKQGAGAGGEIQLTDAMARLMEIQDFYAYEFEGSVHDCGNKTGYFDAVLVHALDNPDTAAFARELVKKIAAGL